LLFLFLLLLGYLLFLSLIATFFIVLLLEIAVLLTLTAYKLTRQDFA